jgi:nucleotide-binding universal stress UspA family protein
MAMTTYRIVVGVDGSDGSQRALQWAAHEAATRGGTVQAVTAWSWDGIEITPHVSANPQEAKTRAASVLGRALAQLAGPDRVGITIATEVVEGRPADVLSAAAKGADLLVLGSHGHSRVRHTVLGSVSEECVRKAGCPVVVIPVPHPAPEPSPLATR